MSLVATAAVATLFVDDCASLFAAVRTMMSNAPFVMILNLFLSNVGAFTSTFIDLIAAPFVRRAAATIASASARPQCLRACFVTPPV